MDDGRPSQVFDQVVFTIVPSDGIEEWQQTDIVNTATQYGAQFLPYNSSIAAEDLHRLSHIISTHVDFPEYQRAIDASIPVVTPEWISHSIAKRRQTVPRQYSPDPSHFFRNVILTIGTLPESDADAIIAGVLALGGQWSEPLTKIVTHIVSTTADNEKSKIAKEKGLPIKTVLPHWFDDCLRLGKMINESPYELPDAEVLRRDQGTPVQIKNSSSISGATVSQPEHIPVMPTPVSPAKFRKDLSAFNKKVVYLNADLGLSEHLSHVICTLIESAGGQITQDLDQAGVYVGRYRDGDKFVDAFKSKITIANLSWLYHVLNRNRWTNPTSKLLHYPVPRNGLPGFSGLRISISNYIGDARVYIQSLVQESGAQFTRTMRQDNTHLITANKSSEKCEAAEEWNIIMINHLWLEESYAKCAVQPLTNSSYTHFPPRTNLGDVCGQVTIDESRIEQMFVLPVLRQRQTLLEQREVHGTDAAAASAVSGADEEHQEEQDEDLMPENVASSALHETAPNVSNVNAAKTNGRRRRTASDVSIQAHAHVHTPVNRQTADGKENQVPAWLSSGRASKMKAIGALHQQADDIAQFQKEMKRKGGVIHGGRQSKEDMISSRGSKRSSDFDADDLDGADQTTNKKAKLVPDDTAILPPIKYRMMVTGDDRWSGHPHKESQDKIKLRQLGIVLTTNPKTVDILVAKSIIRTRKFVAAIARSPIVVSLEYLDHALTKHSLPEKLPLLSDKKAEKLYGFRLADALEQAKINQGKLFGGWEIYVSDDLSGGFETYKDIVSANGGEALAFRGGRRGTTMKKRPNDASSDAGDEDDEHEFAYFVATDSTADKALWKQFRAMAKAQDLQPRVVKVDWLLLAALTQRIHWDEKWSWPTAEES